MSLFNNNGQKPAKTPMTVYNTARSNLLLVVAFTVVNLVLSLINADVYFLFSATGPQFLMGIGLLAEDSLVLTVCAVLAFLGAGVYLLCWLLSKKHRGWMIVALVLFSLDTLAALGMLLADTSMIIDVAIHGWVLFYLITGTSAMVKMKKNPELAVEPAAIPVDEAVYAPVYQVPAEAAVEVPAAPVAPAEIPAETPAQVMVNGEPVEE